MQRIPINGYAFSGHGWESTKDGRSHRLAATARVSHSNCAGIAPGVTSRQDRLSGVIICPVLRKGQRLTAKRHLPRCAVNSITATTALHYKGVSVSVSSNQRLAGLNSTV